MRVPRATTTLSLNNELSAADYGNFVRVTNIKGIPDLRTLELQNLRNASNYGGTTIGTARVRSIEKDGSFRKYYLFDVKMNAGETFSNVRNIGISSTQQADILNALNTASDSTNLPVLNDEDRLIIP